MAFQKFHLTFNLLKFIITNILVLNIILNYKFYKKILIVN